MLEQNRFIELEGVTNFRDVGGYLTCDGKSVKWGKLYRSGDLEALTDVDLARLEGLGLKTIVDFRTDFEIADAPDRIPASVKQILNLTINSESVFDLADVNKGNGAKLMQKLNVIMVREYQKEYAEFLSVLSDPANTPVLCHCSAGKDRTGLAVALFLSALGVSREIIFEDYMVSGPYAVAKYSAIISRYPELLPVMTVERSYLQAAFDTIDADYGGMQAYLVNELKADVKLLRNLYTEFL